MDIKLADKRARRLGARIVGRRDELGMTQDELAEASKVSQGAISRIERGASMPSLTTLHKLRRGLAIEDREWLLWLDLVTDDREPAA